MERCEICQNEKNMDMMPYKIEKLKEALKRRGDFVEVEVRKKIKIYVKDNFDKKTEIKKNEDNKTYSLSTIIRSKSGDEFNCDAFTFEEPDNIAKEKGLTNLKTINYDCIPWKSFYMLPKSEIKEFYTTEEFNKIKDKMRYGVVEEEKVYKENKKIIGEITHSKSCKCGKCEKNNSDSETTSEEETEEE